MDVVEFTPTREQYAYTFGGAAPLMRIKPGHRAAAVVRRRVRRRPAQRRRPVQRRRSTCGSSTRRPDPSTSRAPSRATPWSLHLVALEPARDWGASAAIPFFGGMTSTDRT